MTNLECPEFLKPRLRLFISADIVGSTNIKQSSSRNVGGSAIKGGWFSVIQGFYIESRQIFIEEWDKARSDAMILPDRMFGPSPEVWKTVGDEILFVKNLTDHRQVSTTLTCWLRAIPKLRGFLKEQNTDLDLKCTVWTAGFPVRNKEVVVSGFGLISNHDVEDYFLASGDLLDKHYTSKSPEIIIDFIGPSIDTGFRLAQLSDQRKLIVSLDVAYILSKTMPSDEALVERHELRYQGAAPLKGILDGRHYPIFWIDIGSENIHQVEDKLLGHESAPRDRILDFCKEFYKLNSEVLTKPFIDDNLEQQISSKPDQFAIDHSNLIKSYQKSREDDAIEINNEPVSPLEAGINMSTDELLKEIDRLLGRSDGNEPI